MRRARPASTVRYPARHFGRVLERLLEDSDHSPTAFAQRLGVPKARVSHYARGRTLPADREQVRAVAAGLGLARDADASAAAALLVAWHADLLAATMESAEMTVAEARRAMEMLAAPERV